MEALKISKFFRLGLVGLLLLSLFFLLALVDAKPRSAKEQDHSSQVIDTSPPIEMSKCAPCHRDLNKFKNPNLINFNHPVHFKKGINCSSCHIEWPHQKSRIIKPTMDLCMNCHRLNHSKQGTMASGGCSLCHPPNFKLEPDDHTLLFKERLHSETSRKSDNQKCLICHQGDFCKNCHIAKGLNEATLDSYKFYPVLRPPDKPHKEKITIGTDFISMSGCQVCHIDLGLWKNDKLINFNHPVHFKRGIRCTACHTEWPHKPDEIVRPAMYACSQCHRLSHNKKGMEASGECGLCHPPTMKLKPDFHTVEFVGGDHRNQAKLDRGFCRVCHQQQFCDNCHLLGIDYVPHRLPAWRFEHGYIADTTVAVAANGEFACNRCHLPEGPKNWYQSAPSCAKCHQAVVFPHEEPWAPRHGKRANAVGKGACYTCHQDATFCNKCHKGIDMPHQPNWLGEHRKFLRDNPVTLCLNCHQQSQCEYCHGTHKVHNQKDLYDPGRLGP